MSCSIAEPPLDPSLIVQRLRGLSAAEEFFRELRVPYDPAVLGVSRLHILRRMGEYIEGEELEGLPDSVAAARAQAMLQRAYADFAASSPLRERVFRVLKEHDPARPAAPKVAFVALEDIAPAPRDETLSQS